MWLWICGVPQTQSLCESPKCVMLLETTSIASLPKWVQYGLFCLDFIRNIIIINIIQNQFDTAHFFGFYFPSFCSSVLWSLILMKCYQYLFRLRMKWFLSVVSPTPNPDASHSHLTINNDGTTAFKRIASSAKWNKIRDSCSL